MLISINMNEAPWWGHNNPWAKLAKLVPLIIAPNRKAEWIYWTFPDQDYRPLSC